MPIGPFPDFASCQAHMEAKYGATGAKKVCGAMEARTQSKSDQGHDFNDLPKDAQMLWIDTFAESLQKNDDKASAQVAWANVYRRWEKTPNGQWSPFKMLVEDVKFQKFLKADRVIYGAASVAIKDTDNQLITEEALRAAFDSYRNRGSILFYHQNIPIGKLLPEYTAQDGSTYKSGVHGKQLDVVAQIYKDTQIANEVWNEIEAGRLRAFSIGGQIIGAPVKVCEDANCTKSYEQVNDIDLHEISIVPNPANEASYFNIIKSKVEAVLSKEAKQLAELAALIRDEKMQAVNCPAFTQKALKILEGESNDMTKVDLVELQALKETMKKEILAELATKPSVKKAPGDCAPGEVWDTKLEDCVSAPTQKVQTPMSEAPTEEKKNETPVVAAATTPPPAAPAPATTSEIDALRAQVKELAASLAPITNATKEIAGLKESLLHSPDWQTAQLEQLNSLGDKVAFEPEKQTVMADWTTRLGMSNKESFSSRLDRIAREFAGPKPESKEPKTEVEALKSDVSKTMNSLKATMDEIKALKEKAELTEVRNQVDGLVGIVKAYKDEVLALKNSMTAVPAKAAVNAPADKRTMAIAEDVTAPFSEIVNIQGASQGDFQRRLGRLAKEYGIAQ